MKIERHKKFIKRYGKLPLKIQLKAEERIVLFIKDRQNFLLKDHALSGNMDGKRAFSITGDCRIIYEEKQNGELVFLFLDIGDHSQVY